ncbi:MFS transporter [Kineosporia babensis]
MTSTLQQRRLALFVLFFIPGLSISSWVTRTPAIRDLLGASTAQMGLVLFGLSIGSMAGILSSGLLVRHYGVRLVILLGTLSIVASMPTVGLGGVLSSPVLTAFGLFLFGLGMGGGEIAMNIEGADLEQRLDKPVMPSLHGCFSLGTVIGASAGIAFTAWDFPVAWHLLLVGALALLALTVSIGHVPTDVGKGDAQAAETGSSTTSVAEPIWKDRRLLLIGLIVMAMALAEGTANDWLPLVMVDGHGFAPALGSSIYAVFAASMTIGRFAGGGLIARYGRSAILRSSAISATIGLGFVIFSDSQILAAAAVVLWGLGASLGFPVVISAAGDSGENSAARVSLVATLGYVAFLVGPPLLGYLGDHYGLRQALIVPMVLTALAVFLSPAVRESALRSGHPAQP